MSKPKCGHCNATETRLEVISPRGAGIRMGAVCCNSCHAILGVTDYEDIGDLINRSAQREQQILSTLQNVESLVTQVLQNVR